MNKCLVLFVEGSTEVEFYKELIKKIRCSTESGRLDYKIIYRNVNGIGGFKKEVNRIFLKEILPKVSDYHITVALCYDTDVFGYVQKPKIKWTEVESMLLNDGASKVLHVKAINSIEDWFLYDIAGICSFLKLKQPITLNGTNGYDKLKNLFLKTNKIYTKGREVRGFVQFLNIDLICQNIVDQIKPLYKELAIGGDSKK